MQDLERSAREREQPSLKEPPPVKHKTMEEMLKESQYLQKSLGISGQDFGESADVLRQVGKEAVGDKQSQPETAGKRNEAVSSVGPGESEGTAKNQADLTRQP